MKLALIGYGKMGKSVEQYAQIRGHLIVPIEEADVCIDFTEPKAVLGTVRYVASLKKSIVIGTTGWEKDREEVRKLAEGIGFLYAPNFSLGMALFEKLLKYAAKFLGEDYAISGIEMHHEKKKDIPSGTALSLSKELPGLEFASIRSGFHPGTHQVIFDAPEETVELTHRVRNRGIFAKGALDAAEWLMGKKGFFTFKDYMEEKWKEFLPL